MSHDDGRTTAVSRTGGGAGGVGRDHELAGRDLSCGYEGRPIVDTVSLSLPAGKLSVIIGSNGCGKSTLLKTFARLLDPVGGSVVLDGRDVHRMPTKELARTLGLLPQSPLVPEGIRVSDLVARGRYPHRSLLKPLQREDLRIVAESLDMVGIASLADRVVDELSGGQRQRVWIAMALAQQTDILLLDEPTTYLDVAYQLDILDTLRRINHERGVTIAMVLHDINMAARYADYVYALADGAIVAEGAPHEVVTPSVLAKVFGLECAIIEDPVSHTPLMIPKARMVVPSPDGTSSEPAPVVG